MNMLIRHKTAPNSGNNPHCCAIESGVISYHICRVNENKDNHNAPFPRICFGGGVYRQSDDGWAEVYGQGDNGNEIGGRD